MWRFLDHDTPTSDERYRKARCVGKAIGTVIDWPLACDLHFNETSRVSGGTQAMTTLFGGVLTEVAALIAFVQDNESPSLTLVLSYVGLAMLLIGGMIAILRANEAGSKHRKIHVFDRGAVMFGRYCVVFSSVTVVVVAWACYAVALPGQKIDRRELQVDTVEPYRFREFHEEVKIHEGDAGLRVFVKISPADFLEMKRPDPLVVEISITGRAAKSWQIAEVGSEETDAAPKRAAEIRPVLLESPSPIHKKVLWPHFVPGENRFLVIYLHQRFDELSAEQLQKDILAHTDDGVRVEGRFRD